VEYKKMMKKKMRQMIMLILFSKLRDIGVRSWRQQKKVRVIILP
jgi:hypothetical protein